MLLRDMREMLAKHILPTSRSGHMTSQSRQTAYFSQWESRELTNDVLACGAEIALAEDPNWAASGARDVGEYARWAGNLCGMACLKMILAARTGRHVPMLEFARKCTEYGGYSRLNVL
jgi:hypothetical protein